MFCRTVKSGFRHPLKRARPCGEGVCDFRYFLDARRSAFGIQQDFQRSTLHGSGQGGPRGLCVG